jgi:hypothetical protein
MMSVFHLLWIIPLSVTIGYAACAFAVAAKDGKE